MAELDSFALLVAPDPHKADHFVAYAPDLPGWEAYGKSRGEAANRGSEIIRAIVQLRLTNGEEVPAPSIHATGVPVSRRPAPAPTGSSTEPSTESEAAAMPAGVRGLPFGDEAAWKSFTDFSDEGDGFADAVSGPTSGDRSRRVT